MAKVWLLTKHRKNTCVREAVALSTATRKRLNTAHARLNQHDVGRTGRALAFDLRAYMTFLHYWDVRTIPDRNLKHCSDVEPARVNRLRATAFEFEVQDFAASKLPIIFRYCFESLVLALAEATALALQSIQIHI